MAYHSETYGTDIKLPLLDWLSNSGRGKNVTDLALSLANRAQKDLWELKPWNSLVVDVNVTLSSLSYTFPSDFGRIIDIWGDLEGTGVPSYWYYEADNYESGYKLRDSFDKDTGHSWVITFYYQQSAAIYMRYQKVLEDFTGSGTEYSFFPANLIVLRAQLINAREKGNINEHKIIKDDFEDALRAYTSANQWVNYDPLPRMNDRLGNEIMTQNFPLDGSVDRSYSSLPNGHIL